MTNQVFTKFIFIGLVLIVKWSEAARILSYQPIPYNSHESVLHSLTEELARQGHQLVVLTTMPRRQPIENITEIDVHDISYSTWEKEYDEATKHRNTFAFRDHLEFWNILVKICGPLFDRQFRHPQMQALINDENQRFDLIIVEAVMHIGSMLSARFGAPLLVASAMTTRAEVFSLVGAETNHYYYPDWMPTSSHASKLTFWQNLYSFYNFLRLKYSSTENVQNIFGEKKNYVKMLFLNVHHVWDNNRPVPIGSVLYMDGLHLRSPKSLPQELKTFVDDSKHGVVVVIFGTKLRMSTLPPRSLRVMVDVFSQLPYDFLWKWDVDEMPNKPKNVRLEKSLPLNDLLHNPNVRALISHAGLLSIYEAIIARVPLVSLPIYCDHFLNAEKCEEHGIGIKLDIDSLKEEEFKNAVVAVVEEKKYRDNIDRLSRIFSDRRESPRRGAARLVRQLTTREVRHLRSPLADATFTQFYMLDLLLAATLCVVVAIFAIVFALKRLVLLLGKIGRPVSLPRRLS